MSRDIYSKHLFFVFFILGFAIFVLGCINEDFHDPSRDIEISYFTADSTKEVIVLINSFCSGSFPTSYIENYLNHWGIPYLVRDLADGGYPKNLNSFALIIIGQEVLFDENFAINKSLKRLFQDDLEGNLNIVSFDTQILPNRKTNKITGIKQIDFTNGSHFITEKHKEAINFFSEIDFESSIYSGERILIKCNGENPFLSTLNHLNSKIVFWHTPKWMSTDYFGPMAGLDDCLLRSFIWAAKKPFVFRGLPPIVTLRIDDVGGYGNLVKKSPLYWLSVVNKTGFKPWLGLYLDCLNDEAVNELRNAINDGIATASPHAFKPAQFIYYNHDKQMPLENSEISKNINKVNDWYKKNAPLRMSRYLVPHYYEMGENAIPYLINWNIEFVGLNMALNTPRTNTAPWIKQGPFRNFENPGTVSSYVPLKGNRPVYYADFLDADSRLFNCLTEIRDISGYEWYPNNDIEKTSKNGIRTISRAIDAMALAVLFTHEEVYLSGIKPENVEVIFSKVSQGIKEYAPIYMTMDDALDYVRATKTSQIDGVKKNVNSISVYFKGNSKVKSGYYISDEQNNQINLIFNDIPAFEDNCSFTFNL